MLFMKQIRARKSRVDALRLGTVEGVVEQGSKRREKTENGMKGRGRDSLGTEKVIGVGTTEDMIGGKIRKTNGVERIIVATARRSLRWEHRAFDPRGRCVKPAARVLVDR